MNNRAKKFERPHLHRNHSQINLSSSRSHLSQNSVLRLQASDLQSKKKQGVTLQRHSRISMDTLYDPSVFQESKMGASAKFTSSTCRTSRHSSSKSDFISKKSISSLQGSQYSQPLQAQHQKKSNIQEDIFASYYMDGNPSKNTKLVINTIQFHKQRPVFKRYNLNGIIKY